MYNYKVYVNIEFKDKYTGEIHPVGSILEGLTEERVNEINAVNKELISVLSKEYKKSDEQIANEQKIAKLEAELEAVKNTKKTETEAVKNTKKTETEAVKNTKSTKKED